MRMRTTTLLVIRGQKTSTHIIYTTTTKKQCIITIILVHTTVLQVGLLLCFVFGSPNVDNHEGPRQHCKEDVYHSCTPTGARDRERRRSNTIYHTQHICNSREIKSRVAKKCNFCLSSEPGRLFQVQKQLLSSSVQAES